MHKIRTLLILTALLATQPILAYAAGVPGSKPCSTLAHRCAEAGFARTEVGGKNFWLDCLKPLLMGHSVQGVTIDVADVQACRTDKIKDLQKELQDLQHAASKSPTP